MIARTIAAGAVVAPDFERNTKQDHEDDEDNSSPFSDDNDSLGSLFSSDDDETDPSTLTLKDLEMEFKARDELLERLVYGIDPKYARMMRQNEEAVRAHKMLRVQQNLSDDRTSRTSISSQSLSAYKNDEVANVKVVVDKSGLEGKLFSHAFSFDMQNRLQGALILILNCIAYNGGEQIVRSFVVFLSQNEEFESQTFLPAMMILASFIVLCMTGGIFDYVNDDAMMRVKFDMKNRFYLGKWDALIIKWFHKHDLLATTLNVLTFFTFVYCVYIYQEKVMSWAFDIRYEVFQGLPSVKQGVITYPSKVLAAKFGEEELERMLIGETTCAAGVCSQDEVHDNITRQDEAYLASKMAFDCYEDLMGDKTASVVTEATLFWYYTISVIVAVVALRMLGHKFWSI